jgi:prolyl-tRNA synthetase
VVQSCTSHDLGQKFSKVFGISFQNQQGDNDFVWQTSWGLSTRSIGALILAHGDDNGLCLPPKVAPTQVVIIPAKITDEIIEYCEKLRTELIEENIRTIFEGGDSESFGFKLNKWEVKGAPIVLKVGPKEIENGVITIRRRDTLTDSQIDHNDAINSIRKTLDDIQHDMLISSRQYRDENTRVAGDYEEFKRLLEEHGGFIKVFWNDDAEIEKKIKDETRATSRCRLTEKSKGIDFYTGEPASDVWLFAQSY